MNFEKLLDALADGDDEIEICIKRTIDGDDEDACEECGMDSCPLDEEEEDFDDVADEGFDISAMADDLAKEVKDVYDEILKKDGKEAADKMIDLSIQQTLIHMAIKEKLPIRDSDVEKYNSLVEGEHGDWYSDLMYLIHSGILREAGEKIKKK